VDLTNAKMSLNPFCEIALEEAVRLKERGQAGEVVAVTVSGPPGAPDHRQAPEGLRTALALGADRAIHVELTSAAGPAGPSSPPPEPLAVARALADVARREQPSLVLLGKQSIDNDMAATGPMLAGLLRWPQAASSSRVELRGGGAVVAREVEGGEETVESALPLVVTADLRLNQPRFPSLPNVMKAKKRPIEVVKAALEGGGSGGGGGGRVLETVMVESPAQRKGGVMVGSVEELVRKLVEEKVF
jgi:electron transfer flavoprotein beta subunit